jgi:predicted transcriptional regulator
MESIAHKRCKYLIETINDSLDRLDNERELFKGIYGDTRGAVYISYMDKTIEQDLRDLTSACTNLVKDYNTLTKRLTDILDRVEYRLGDKWEQLTNDTP